MLIARLIAEPDSLAENLERATGALGDRGVRVALASMLQSCGETVQIDSPDDDIDVMRAVLDEHFAPGDGLVTEREPVVPRVFVSDMDSTMITAECIDELADFAGLKQRIAAITERAMQGELDFESALRERVGLLAGLPESAVAECLETRIQPMAGARTLVQTLRAAGCRTILVTGGFHHFADPVAEMLGFDEVIANRLDVASGKLVGDVSGPIVDSAVKKQALVDAVAKAGEGVPSLATGDGANDIPMLQAATYGIAYRGKAKTRAAANGWVDRGDLTAILQLLGIPKNEWVTQA